MVGQKKYWERSSGARSCLLLLAAWATACAGSSTDTASASVPLDQLTGKLADALCDNLAGCCQAAAIAFDAATCKQSYSATTSANLNAEMNPHTVYDAAAAGRCLSAFASGIKSCLPIDSIDLSVCDTVFVGTQPLGGDCTSRDQCARSAQNMAYCSSETGTTGTCMAQGGPPAVHGKAGDSCLDTCTTEVDCVTQAVAGTGAAPEPVCFTHDGLFCDLATSTCQPLVAVGAACAFDSCVAGAFCLAGVCTLLLADGAACQDGSECLGGSCLRPDPSVDPGVCGKAVLADDKICAGNFN